MPFTLKRITNDTDSFKTTIHASLYQPLSLKHLPEIPWLFISTFITIFLHLNVAYLPYHCYVTTLHEITLCFRKQHTLFELNKISICLTVDAASSGIQSICMLCFSTMLASYETRKNKINTRASSAVERYSVFITNKNLQTLQHSSSYKIPAFLALSQCCTRLFKFHLAAMTVMSFVHMRACACPCNMQLSKNH